MSKDNTKDVKKDKKSKEFNELEEKEKKINVLDEGDINLLKRYGMGPYSENIKKLEEEHKTLSTEINKLCGIKESDTGLALPS